MKTIKNIQKLSLSELLTELYNSDDETYICYSDLFNHFRKQTNNFDPTLTLHLMADIYYFIPKIEIDWNGDIRTLRDLYNSDIIYQKYDLDKDKYTKGMKGVVDLYQTVRGNNYLISISDGLPEFEPEEIEYLNMGALYIQGYVFMVDRKAKELNIEFDYRRYGQKNLSGEKDFEVTNPSLKRPQNSHNQQYSILEQTGVIGYLKSKYKGITDVALAELIANILNRDTQNTRVKLSFTGTKNQVSNEIKNKDFIKKMFAQIGLKNIL